MIYANDICPKKQAMYEGHFGVDHFACRDIHELSPDDIPDVDLATASFPCTDLSLAGAREGLQGKQSSAFWGFTGLLDSMGSRRPPVLLIENVPAFLTSHNGSDFQSAMLELNRLGYTVDAVIINAAWFVPQSRERLFIIATKSSEQSDENHPLPMTSVLRPVELVRYILEHNEIRWQLRDLTPPAPSGSGIESILESLPDENPYWWSKDRTDYLINQMSPRHSDIVQRLIPQPHWNYGTVFRRMRNGKSTAELRTDGIAGCLRTPKGGSAKQILVRIGNGRVNARWLTPRECARLMGADNYNIVVDDNDALFGFGDAVCVHAVRWLACSYLNQLDIKSLRQGFHLESS